PEVKFALTKIGGLKRWNNGIMHLPSTPVLEYPHIPLARLCRNQSSRPYFTAETQGSQVNFGFEFFRLGALSSKLREGSPRAELHRSLKQHNQNSNTLVLQHSISFLSPTSAL